MAAFNKNKHFDRATHIKLGDSMRKVLITIIGVLVNAYAMTALAATQKTNIVEVELVQPQTQTNQRTIELSGTVMAEQDAQLAVLEAGLVKALFVEAGDKVTAGQTLLSLDNTLAKLRLRQAQADYQSAQVQQQEAKRQYDEVLLLSKNKVVSESLIAERKASLDNAKSQVNNAQARLALQKEIVKRHTLTAPFDGVIAQRNVNLGEWVSQQSQVFRLVSNQSLRLIVDLPQEYLKAFSNQSQISASVIPDVMPDKQYQLPITSLVPVTRSASRTMQVRINLPNDTVLIPGMSARARINFSAASDSSSSNNSTPNAHFTVTANTLSSIPRKALKRHPDGGNSVFAVNQDNFNAKSNNSDKATEVKINRHKIELVKSDMDQVTVAGLPANLLVVVSGTELLKDNQLVSAKLIYSEHVDSEKTGSKSKNNKGDR